MKKRLFIISFILFIIIFIGIMGYLIMSKESYPDTPAFQDEFTREFLNVEGETPEGFHLFESWTHKYSILFPENYVMSDGSYYRKKSQTSDEPDTENVYLSQKGISPKENDIIKGVNLFLIPDGNNLIEASISVIIRRMGAPEDTDIEEFSDENKTVYYVEHIDEFHADDGSIDTYFYLYGLITENDTKQGLYFELEDTCFDSDTKPCEIDFEAEKDMGVEMMKSIEFKEIQK